MIFCVERTFLIAAIFLLNIKLYTSLCGRAEYEIDGECCPMCSPGNRVYRHCTEFTSTTCMPCVGLTFTDEPNGLSSCLSCTVCDAGQGLREKMACKKTSDTVCEPQEGFYCTDEYKDNCRYAVEHTKCSPGQYIKQKGTTHKDAECAECSDGTFSDGTLQVCKQHTKCEDLGLVEKTPGTKSFDAECEKTSAALTAGITAVVVVVVVVVLVLAAAMFYKIKHKKNPPTGVPPSPGTDEQNRLSNNHMLESNNSPALLGDDRMDASAFSHSGHVTSPVENDCGKQCYDLQDHELQYTGVT